MSHRSPSERFIRELTGSQARLLGYVCSLVPDLENAQEVLQDTNVVLWGYRNIASIVWRVGAEDANGEKQTLVESPVLKSGGNLEHRLYMKLPDDSVKLHPLVDDVGDEANCDHAN